MLAQQGGRGCDVRGVVEAEIDELGISVADEARRGVQGKRGLEKGVGAAWIGHVQGEPLHNEGQGFDENTQGVCLQFRIEKRDPVRFSYESMILGGSDSLLASLPSDGIDRAWEAGGRCREMMQ